MARKSMAQKAEEAIKRGNLERMERADIYRKHPSLKKPWMPIHNLRRAARKLEEA